MKYLGSKTLETERLILHKTEEKDLKILWNILRIEDVSRYYLTAKINDDWEKEKGWQMKKLQNASNPDVFIWTIELKDTQDVIGQISFHPTDQENIMDIGWFLDPKFQKKGYAYEAAITAINYMFSECGLEKIETCVCPKNPNSYRLMEKLGFQKQKKTRMVKYTIQPQEEQCIEYHLTEKDFRSNKKEG